MANKETLIFYLNCNKIEVNDVDPRWTLANFLRYKLHLTGTKIGCNTGGCGSCVVMVSDRDFESGLICHRSLISCLTPICSVHGKSVTTVEGVGDVTHMHAIQERLSACHGSQCGFCTPGFVMSMYTLLRNNSLPTTEDIDEALQGNLCRCTGYRPILEAFYSFSEDSQKVQCSTLENCCMAKRNEENSELMGQNVMPNSCCIKQGDTTKAFCQKREEFKSLCDLSKCGRYDPTQEPIFPPELQLDDYSDLFIKHKDVSWFQPKTLAQLLKLKAEFPHAKLVNGNTVIGVEAFKFAHYPVLINPQGVAELSKHILSDDGIYLGSNINLNKCKSILLDIVKGLPESKTKVFKEVIRMLHWFAGRHVRNAASIAGSLATALPTSDLNPVWLATGATVTLASAYSQRSVKIDQKFFMDYRKTAIEPEEVILGILMPFSQPNQYFITYKQAQRRVQDMAIVNAAMNVQFNEGTKIVHSITLAFGGMANRTILVLKTCQKLTGKEWNEDALEIGLDALLEDLLLPPGATGGMEKFRQTLCLSFFFKFYNHVLCSLNNESHKDSDVREVERPVAMTQIFQDVCPENKSIDPVGRPIMHMSGRKHVTGEAPFCDDIRKDDALHLALVMSTKANAKLLSLDPSDALNLNGVVAFVDHSDIPGDHFYGNHYVTGIADTPVFAENEVTYYGQPIGAIVANDHELARKAAAKVKVQYEEFVPIVTIEDAIEAHSFHQSPMLLTNKHKDGKPVTDFDWSKFEHVISASARVGGQEHFYMETNNCMVTPVEVGQYEVVSSTQNPSDIQQVVSKVLGIARHKVVVKVKRIGGGFGGKITASAIYATATAVAACKLGRAVRCKTERFDNMVTSGTRHPYLSNYSVAFDKEGHIQAYKMDLFSNAGHKLDQSKAVMHHAMTFADNAYDFGDVLIKGQMCRTNLMSCTAFRGFGTPQVMFLTECMLDHVATTLHMQPDKVREVNMYNDGDVTYFDMTLDHCNVRPCWNECKLLSDYDNRKLLADDLNKKQLFKKHGIAMIPLKYGIAFGRQYWNQAGALVHLYLDGSVLVSIAGTEMGQGLHTKVTQIAAKVLHVPMNCVTISETSTDKVPNTLPTAASVGSDLNGQAVKNACETILNRLEPYKLKQPDIKWVDLVNLAYEDMVSLSTTGFAKFKIVEPDFESGKGNPHIYNYFVYGAAYSEVEVDCLTGDHRVLRSDIVMDVGQSLNPAIDIGQIEGSFIQGYGLYTMEELKCSPKGVIYTRGPDTYKIPSVDDVPRQFNVKFLKGSSNERAIYSSKAVGEPALFLGASVFFAIKDAIRAARKDNGLTGHFVLNSPATPEKIRLAIEDELCKKVQNQLPEDSSCPWTVQL